MSNEFILSDKYELLALHRGLMEARFCPVANDLDVSGSPILSAIHRRVVDSLVAFEDPESILRWRQWLEIDDQRREWGVAVQRAVKSSRWTRLGTSAKKQLACDLLSPFHASDEAISCFVELVENLLKEREATGRIP